MASHSRPPWGTKQMKALRFLAILSFLLGAGLLVLGFVRSGDGNTQAAPEPVATFGPPTPTAIPPGAAPEKPPDATPEPTPTGPPPFDGAVAKLTIPRFKVNSVIESIGLIPNTNQLDTPRDPHNTGWYNQYDKPGFGGNSVFSAHVDYFPNILGPFYNLKKIDPDDEITVVMENGLEYRYRVISKQQYNLDDINMAELIWPTTKPAGAEWITLITCGGQFVKTEASGAGKYLSRDVVIAQRSQ